MKEQVETTYFNVFVNYPPLTSHFMLQMNLFLFKRGLKKA